ncbi:MAG: hypothetical protein JWN61_3229 [Pseudonocardiales bacterium]|nr:hypothetical protein [Pseudonocardiales bacterium]
MGSAQRTILITGGPYMADKLHPRSFLERPASSPTAAVAFVWGHGRLLRSPAA